MIDKINFDLSRTERIAGVWVFHIRHKFVFN